MKISIADRVKKRFHVNPALRVLKISQVKDNHATVGVSKIR